MTPVVAVVVFVLIVLVGAVCFWCGWWSGRASLREERIEFRRMESVEHRKTVLRDAAVRPSAPGDAPAARVTQARLRRDGTNVHTR